MRKIMLATCCAALMATLPLGAAFAQATDAPAGQDHEMMKPSSPTHVQGHTKKEMKKHHRQSRHMMKENAKPGTTTGTGSGNRAPMQQPMGQPMEQDE